MRLYIYIYGYVYMTMATYMTTFGYVWLLICSKNVFYIQRNEITFNEKYWIFKKIYLYSMKNVGYFRKCNYIQ